MKKILTIFLALMLSLSCIGLVACGSQDNMQSTLDMYIFDQEGQTLSEDFVLPGYVGNYKATWTSDNEIISLTEIPKDAENGIERQYLAQVGLPEERQTVNLTVAITKLITKTFTVYVNPLDVYNFSGSYNFVNNNGTVVSDFALDTTCEFKGHVATIEWSVPEEFADYLAISEDGKTCIVYPSSLNPKVKINATFTYDGKSTTKGYSMTVSEQKEPLQEVDYWYTNTGVGIVMSGYVVSIATVYSENYKNVSLYMVNDEFTAGYYLYRVKTDSANAALLAPGVHITVTGTTNTNYNGLMETNAGGKLVVDGDIPAINVNEKVYAIDNDIIGDLQTAYYNQARLVSLSNWTVKEIKGAPDLSSGTQTLFVLTKGGVNVPVVISKYYEGAYAYKADDATCSALIGLQSTLKVGDVVSVTGILGNYKGHQIAPLTAESIVVGGTADAEGTVYAGQKAAKAIAAIDKLFEENGLDGVIASNKNVVLPADVESCAVEYRIIGNPRSMSIAEGALVINPGKIEKACLTANVTVDGFTTTIFRYLTAVELDDAGKVGMEAENFALSIEPNAELSKNTTVELPANGSIFEEIAITWTLDGEAVSGFVEFKQGVKEATYTLVGTLALNNAVETLTYTVKVAAKPAKEMVVVEKPVVGTAYKFGVNQVTLGETLYVTGAQTGERYLVTTNDAEAASDVYVEEATGGIKIYVLDGSTKKYLHVYMNDASKTALAFDANNASVFTYDATTKAYVTDLQGTPYYPGAYNDFNTLSASKTSYINADNTGVTQFPANFYGEKGQGGEVEPPVEDKPLVEGKGYAMYLNQLENGTTLYFNGQTESASVNYRLATTENKAEAVAVYVEYVANGFHLYFNSAEGVKTYIRVYERTAGDAGYGKGSLEFTTSVPAEVYTWDETLGLPVVTSADGLNQYYMGTYSNYVTMSVSNTSYITGKNAANLRVTQFPVEFELIEGGDAPVVCEHTGGSATCKELAKCEKCGEPYGELADHNFAEGECTVCGEKDPDYVAPEVPGTYAVITDLSTIKTGDKILIGAPAYGKLLSMVKTGNYNVGVDYTATDFSKVTDNEIFVVTVNADGSYSFTSVSGKALAMAGSYSSLNDTGANTTWTVTAGAEGIFFVKNNGRGNALEWYNQYGNWSTYTLNTSDKQFQMSFYLVEGGNAPVVCEHTGGSATCKELAKCEKCGEPYGELADHNFAEGECTVCGEKDPDYVAPEVGNTTATVVIADYAAANGWADATLYDTINVDANVSVVASGTPVGTYSLNTGKYYESSSTWRIYQNESPAVVVSVVDGYVIVSIKITYNIKNTGILTFGDSQIASGTVVEINAASATFSVGNTGTKTNGQAQITAIEVVYAAATPEHKHNFNILKGIHSDANHWYECECGEIGTEVVPHVDANLDITCDYEGCTKRILPAEGSKISLFTANAMIIVSAPNYYVEGVVTEITDAKNGYFIIQDEAGDTILIRLPKDADGNLYSKWTVGKVVVGDTVQVYGKPAKNTSAPTTQKAKIEGGLLTVLKHEHKFSEPTCTEPATCECLVVGDAALGHNDADKNGFCDRCEWNMSFAVSTINTHTDPATGTNGVKDNEDTPTSWTWSDDQFDVIIAKGTSTFTLYKSEKAYMQLKKLNTLTIVNKNGLVIDNVTISTTSETQLTNLKNALAGIEFTADDAAFTVNIKLNSAENFTFTNNGTQTAYIASVVIVYAAKAEEAPVVCEHEGGEATCKVQATCTKCGEAYGELADHSFAEGVCTVCGEADPNYVAPEAPVEATVSKSHTEIASIAGVTAGQNTGVIANKTIALDENISIVCAKGGSTSDPCIYTESIRLYQNGATLTVKAAEGCTIKQVIITLATKSGGQGPITVTGGTASALDGYVYTITANEGVSEIVVKTAGTDKNNRLYVANIEVVYEA